MEADFITYEEEEVWKCRKHPSRHRSGVCPSCLRDRLLLLCPDCANMRPCSCLPSSSSSSSSFSSSRSYFVPARSSVSGAIGSIGPVSSLIESEVPFRRSGSAAFPFTRRRSDEAAERKERETKWQSLWGFLRAKEKKAEADEEQEKLSRSRSVGVPICSNMGGGEGRLKGKKWHFPSPMRAFRHKKRSKVVLQRSPPLCRG